MASISAVQRKLTRPNYFALLVGPSTISRSDNVKKTIINSQTVNVSPTADRKQVPERFATLEYSHRKVTLMSGFTNVSALVSLIDASKVRMGGFAPTLATVDASKVRMGGFAPALATVDASKVRMGGFAPSLPARG
jgi:hypothetical protein